MQLVYVSHEWETQARAGKYASYGLSMAKKFVATLDLLKVRHWERALVARTDAVTVINPSDLVPFRAIDASRKYLPLTPGYSGPITLNRTITEAVPRRVLILGGRRSEQKQQVLLDWLAVSYRALGASGIDMTVVGDMPDGLRQRLRRDYPEVEIVGFVEDLNDVVARARVGLIVDTVGGGFKLRLLSHVFQRLPIVGLGAAIDGLPTLEGQGYLAASSLEELVRLVVRVIDDLDRLNSLHQRAFADCEEEFSWSQRARALSSLTAANADRLLQ